MRGDKRSMTRVTNLLLTEISSSSISASPRDSGDHYTNYVYFILASFLLGIKYGKVLL